MKRRLKKNPVEMAVIKALMQDMVRTLAMRSHMLEDGEDVRDLLTEYTFVLGLGAQTSLVLNDDLARTKRLHAALRTVLGMAVDGVWIPAQSVRIYELAKEGIDLAVRHNHIAVDHFQDARWLAARVMTGLVTMDDVSGVEIYQGVKE